MYELMASCFQWLKRKREPERAITLIVIGLDDAGKTTTVASIQGEPPEGITPTVGFGNKTLTINGKAVTAYDLGGGAKFRAVWKKYYAEVYGVIFVVDSCNKGRLEESKDVLHDVIEHSRIVGKPILLLANKQDKEGALSLDAIEASLDLPQLSEKLGFKYIVLGCSALKGHGRKLDPKIKQGLQWLLSSITSDIDKLGPRVDNDVAVQKEENEKEKQARLERIRKIREERERQEREAGIEPEGDSDEDVVASGNFNPFQPINKHLENVEKKKLKKKPKQAKKQENVENNQDELKENTEMEEVEKAPPKKKKKKKKKKIQRDLTSPDPQACQDEDGSLAEVKRKGKKKERKPVNVDDTPVEELEVNNGVMDRGDHDSRPKRKGKGKKGKLGSKSSIQNDVDELTYSNGDLIHENSSTNMEQQKSYEGNFRGGNLEPLETAPRPKKKKGKMKRQDVDEVDGSTPIEGGAKQVKTKKKRKKTNRTAPAPTAAPEEPTENRLPPLPPPAWKTPPGTLNRLPALSPLRSDIGSLPPSLGPIKPFGAKEGGLFTSFNSVPNGDDNDVVT